MSKICPDVTIVGAGIAGLWTAKELLDAGYSVAVVEKNEYLASGATIKNEGWLHAGPYHGAILDDEDTALQVAGKIRQSYDTIVEFAPECIEPQVTFALLGEGPVALRALERWRMGHITHELIDNPVVFGLSEGISIGDGTDVYRVDDRSVNTALLCAKLASNVIERGGVIFTNAIFEPLDDCRADLVVQGKAQQRLVSEQFVITAGSGTKEVSDKLGVELAMRYFKAHLLVFPRLTQSNFFSIDSYDVNFMNHGESAVAGLNLDTTEVSEPDTTVVEERGRMILDALSRLIPHAYDYADLAKVVACIKPGIQQPGGPRRPGVEPEIIQLSEGYLAAFPGKMTEAPHLAKEIVAHVLAKGVTPMSSGRVHLSTRVPLIAKRPLDG